MLARKRLNEFLTQNQSDAEIVFLEEDTRTVAEATAVYDQQIIYGGGGDVHALMKLMTEELKRVVGTETLE